MLLKNKKIIITGGGRGIGLEVAHAFAKEGATLLLVSRTESELRNAQQSLEKWGTEIRIFCGDISQKACATEIVQFAKEDFCGVDVLVNNAAIIEPIGSFIENSLEMWEKAIQINLLGPVYLSHAVLPLMLKQGRGKIINVSGGGEVSPRFSGYGSSKAALIRFTESVAEELKETGVTMNIIAPGPSQTKIAEQIVASGALPLQLFSDSYEPITRMFLFLASEKSDGITGKLLSARWDDLAWLESQKKQLMESDVFAVRRILPKDRGWGI